MSSDHLSLTNLPLVVQDNILECVHTPALLSLSLTCHSLHRAARKYLYRKVHYFVIKEAGRELFEKSLQNNPVLVSYLREFTSYDRSFFQWMWSQSPPPALRKVKLYWKATPEDGEDGPYSDFLALIPPSNRLDIKSLAFRLASLSETVMRRDLAAFSALKCLTLSAERKPLPSYTLQAMLQQLRVPSLQFLEVVEVGDWRIQWRDSFKDALPNLQGLRLEVPWGDPAMWNAGEFPDYDLEETIPPPSNIMWDTVLTLSRHSVFFDIEYPDETHRYSAFLDYAPAYASAHQLHPVPLIQWLVKSKQFVRTMEDLDSIFIPVGPVSSTDLTTILRGIQSTELRAGFSMDLSLDLPTVTTPSIATLLHHAVRELDLYLEIDVVIDPSFIPACISSLPNLKHLHVGLRLSDDFSLRFNECFAATYSFASLIATHGNKVQFNLNVSRSGDPVWTRMRWWGDPPGTPCDIHPGDGVAEMETEVQEWFHLSTSLQKLSVEFYRG